MLTKNFINKAKKIHGDKYNYSLVNYINNRTKVKIICETHGEFEQRPDSHLYGSGCKKCSNEKQIKTNEYFINEGSSIHKGKYDYSLLNYKNCKSKIKIICPIHGEFEQTPSTHLKGGGCYNCYKENCFKTTEEFIKEAILFHGDKYDYSLVDYKESKQKVKIICKKHGEFEQRPSNHLSGQNCPKCAKNSISNINDMIKKATLIHGEIYDYSLSTYINCDTKINIICSKHGVFKQTPYQHINRMNGCPICNESNGEREIRLYLSDNKITYIPQHKFSDCKYKRLLPFDFYLPEYNTCIEYDGEQHKNLFGFEKNDDKLKIRIIRDDIKTKYCLEKNIKLIRINYTDNILIKLKEIYDNICLLK
jgi:hypothetical protein